jgi:antitoxin component YwqK of YwqJK toxin-antitoxin module
MVTEPRIRRLLPLLAILLAALLAPLPAVTQEAPKPDVECGQLTYRRPKTDSAEEAPKPAPVVEIAGGLRDANLDWGGEYRQDRGGQLSQAGRTTLELALAEGYDRKQTIKDLKAGGDETAPLVRNLDVGRHEIMKALYHRAFEMTNERLKREKRSPLKRVVPVNAGGTGDYTRDQDITAFAGDEYQEKVFFECLEKAAGEFTVGEKTLIADKKDTGGIDFPQIEVTVFPGRNDTPDPRFATDVETFKLEYSKVLKRQTQDVEAYIGGGTDIEVKGRRRPGQMHVQEIALADDGSIRYRSEIPGNHREAKAIFTEYGQERFDNWQRASHIFSDYVQAYRHWQHGEHDPTKGPLKYLGRAAEHLCAIRGRKPWKELTLDEKIDVLATLYPKHSRDSEGGRKILARMVDVIDTADTVKTSKKLPGGKNAELGSRIALIFLRKAFAATGGEMARDWLDPPPFDPSMLKPEERARWDAMTPAERHLEAVKRNKVYAQCVSHAAMENLVLTMAMLRQMDQAEGKPNGKGDGEAAIRQMIDAERAPSVRAVLEIADELSRTYLAHEQTGDARAREASRQKLVKLREKLKPFLKPGQEPPGEKLLADMERLGPKLYLEEDVKGRRTPMGAAAEELKARFAEHMKQAFPTTAEQWRGFRRDVAQRGWKGYVAKKVLDEAFQLDTISDCLTLIEMYQDDATMKDYAVFVSVNVLSRFHWSFSHLYAAWNVKTVEDLKGLGKGLVFVTLARVIPGAGTAKILFDIGAGLVRVTVGYSIKLTNAELVDAIYTGEKGRKREDTEPVWGTRNRFSGWEVLPPNLVRRLDEEKKDASGKLVKTGRQIVLVDRPGVYRHFFGEWTGLEIDDRHPMRQMKKGSNILVNANDRLADLLLKQAQQFGRTWVSAKGKTWFKPHLEEKEVQSAMTSLHQSLTNWARKRVQRILSEGSFRSYKSIFDKVDVIEEGLVRRFAADLLYGMIEHWSTYYTAQLLAMREIERTAALMDMSEAAKLLGQGMHRSIVGRPEADVKRIPVAYELDVEIHGREIDDSDVYDGAIPVRVSAFLKGTGEVGEREEEVEISVKPSGARILRKGEGNEGGDGLIEPGDLIENTVLVRAVQAGRVLAEKPETIQVLMPAEEEGETLTLKLFRHEERGRDGRLRERYVYFKRFSGMPREWQDEYGEVYHGKYERFNSDESLGEEREFRYGVLQGPSVSYDRQGRWVLKVPYRDGELHGTRIHRDPDSKARLEIDYEKGATAEERSYGESGQMLRKVTYEHQPDGTVAGVFEGWWPNGNPRFKGRYSGVSSYAVVSSKRGGAEGETAPGKQGLWEVFHENGAPARRETWVDDVLEGAYERLDGEGKVLARGSYHEGKASGAWLIRNREGGTEEGAFEAGERVGVWTLRDAEGRPLGSVAFKDGERIRGHDIRYHENGTKSYEGRWTEKGRQGVCIDYFDNGNVRESTTWRDGRREGAHERRSSEGKLLDAGSYRNHEKEGPWTEWSDWPEQIASGRYAAGVREGRWEFRSHAGKRMSWKVYRNGEVVDSGYYED